MAEQIVDLLHELNEKDGQTIVLVTHDRGIGESASRLIQMRDGQLTSDERHVSLGQRTADLLASGAPAVRG